MNILTVYEIEHELGDPVLCILYPDWYTILSEILYCCICCNPKLCLCHVMSGLYMGKQMRKRLYFRTEWGIFHIKS